MNNKRIEKYLMIMGTLLCLIMPQGIHALTGSIDVNCSTAIISPNNTANCNITGTTDEEINAVDMKIILGDNLILTDVAKDDIWQGDIGTDGVIRLTTNTNQINTFNIATFQVKAENILEGKDTKIEIKYVQYSDASFNEYGINGKEIEVRIPSTINTLKSLKISEESVQDFSSTKTEYTYIADPKLSTINITAEATSNTAEISGDIGEQQISYGENIYVVKVFSELGEEKDYTITAIKNESRELASLKINDEYIQLVSGKYEYSIDVKNEVQDLKIEANLKDDATASFVNGYGSREINSLKEGKNEVLIKIINNKEEELTYTIIINRLSAEKENNNIVPQTTKTVTTTTTKKATINPKTGPVSLFGISIILIIAAVLYIRVRKIKFFDNQ